MKRSYWLLLLVFVLIGTFAFGWLNLAKTPAADTAKFNGERALQDDQHQLELGARTPGSKAHRLTAAYFTEELEKSGWRVEIQETEWEGRPVRNVIAKRGSGDWLILGAHYDSRMAADEDPDPALQAQAVPGANDGASGAAVLLELGRTLPADLDQEIWLVFFDAEDQGRLPGWDWILGSSAMAASLSASGRQPEAVIIVDMIGDADLNIYMEQNSDAELTRQLWAIAAELGYADQFIPQYKYAILDDHTPFLNLGIPAVDIIDFDYPYWHTTQDTLDKISADSLEAVGHTLQQWITEWQDGFNSP